MCQIDLDGQVSASETKGARSKIRTHGQEPPLSARTVQIQIYRMLDPARKLRAVFEMFELALQLARSGTRMRHPDWTDEQVEVEARRLVTGSHSAREQTMSGRSLEQIRAFGGVIDILEAMDVEYLIWGGVATALYGEPRFTQDMDLVLRLNYHQGETLARLLVGDGYYVSSEAVRDAIGRHFHFNAIHLETGIKVDFSVEGPDPVLAWAFKHARRQPFDEIRSATFMPAEAVILAKLRAYQASNSDRHRRDVEGMLRVSGPDLDMDYIGLTAARLGLVHLWRELQETAMEE